MKTLPAHFLKVAIFLLLTSQAVLSPSQANECQIVDGNADGLKEALVSATELTRIAIDGGRITSVKQHEDAPVEVQPDKASGQAFLALKKREPFRLFILSASGRTHALSLKPTDAAVACIVIREPAPPAAAVATPVVDRAQSSSPPAGSASNFEGRSTAVPLIVQMARGEKPWDAEVVPANKEVPLWAESRFVLLERYKGRLSVGEHYRLTNISSKQMRLAEQEFFKEGVLAVSIEVHELPPGATTEVFILTTPGSAQ
jgi:conjugal transfer pilus assembly protein TraK